MNKKVKQWYIINRYFYTTQPAVSVSDHTGIYQLL